MSNRPPLPRRTSPADGVRLALTTFTIAPVRPGEIDRTAARIAIGVAPYVGLLLGLVVGGLAIGLRAVSSPALVTGFVCVAALAGLTRGLHLDGLADTVDGLGSYRHRERALEIMKSPEVGPFGVVALVLAIVIPAACIASMTTRPWWAVLAGLAVGVGSGRLAVTFACRRGVPAASPSGLGALVAATAGPVELGAGLLVIAAVATAAVPDRPWQGPLAVLAALGATTVLVTHARRRLGGITGDVLGACVETAVAVALVGLVLGS